jgi:hypothetical protein
MSVYKLGPATIAIEPVTAVTGVTLNGAITSASAITISLSSDTDLPDKGIVTIDTEEVLYMTHSSGSISNCIRGFRGTTATTHTDGTSVTHSFSILGDTLGGITYTTEETSQQLKTDQAGETPVDEVITGLKASIEANLAEITLDNIAMLYKTTVEGSGTSRRVELKSQVGYSNLTNAKKAIIIPYDGADLSDDVEDLITFVQAGIVASGSRTFDGSNQQVIKLTMTGYPDSSQIVVVLGKEA